MKCEFCDKVFENKSRMANHVRWTHKRGDNVVKCIHCNNEYQTANIISHQNGCKKNPQNIKKCLNCNKNCYRSKFCSRHCSSTYNNQIGITGFKKMVENGTHPFKGKETEKWEIHRKICFKHWDEKCAVCGWYKCVDVHHIDGNSKNNDPKNLIPLCKNHHVLTLMNQYKNEINSQIFEIISNRWGPSPLNSTIFN